MSRHNFFRLTSSLIYSWYHPQPVIVKIILIFYSFRDLNMFNYVTDFLLFENYQPWNPIFSPCNHVNLEPKRGTSLHYTVLHYLHIAAIHWTTVYYHVLYWTAHPCTAHPCTAQHPTVSNCLWPLRLTEGAVKQLPARRSYNIFWMALVAYILVQCSN